MRGSFQIIGVLVLALCLIDVRASAAPTAAAMVRVTDPAHVALGATHQIVFADGHSELLNLVTSRALEVEQHGLARSAEMATLGRHTDFYGHSDYTDADLSYYEDDSLKPEVPCYNIVPTGTTGPDAAPDRHGMGITFYYGNTSTNCRDQWVQIDAARGTLTSLATLGFDVFAQSPKGVIWVSHPHFDHNEALADLAWEAAQQNPATCPAINVLCDNAFTQLAVETVINGTAIDAMGRRGGIACFRPRANFVAPFVPPPTAPALLYTLGSGATEIHLYGVQVPHTPLAAGATTALRIVTPIGSFVEMSDTRLEPAFNPTANQLQLLCSAFSDSAEVASFHPYFWNSSVPEDISAILVNFPHTNLTLLAELVKQCQLSDLVLVHVFPNIGSNKWNVLAPRGPFAVGVADWQSALTGLGFDGDLHIPEDLDEIAMVDADIAGLWLHDVHTGTDVEQLLPGGSLDLTGLREAHLSVRADIRIGNLSPVSYVEFFVDGLATHGGVDYAAPFCIRSSDSDTCKRFSDWPDEGVTQTMTFKARAWYVDRRGKHWSGPAKYARVAVTGS